MEWGTLLVSVFGPNSKFGFEDLFLEGFHDYIILERFSQNLGFEIFLLLNHNFHFIYSLFSSIPIVFGSHLLVVHRVLQSDFQWLTSPKSLCSPPTILF